MTIWFPVQRVEYIALIRPYTADNAHSNLLNPDRDGDLREETSRSETWRHKIIHYAHGGQW